MIKEMTAAELESECRTYISLTSSQNSRAKMLLSGKFSRVEEDESDYIRVYDEARSEEIVSYLYENGITVSEIGTSKIGLEEYYMDLMHEKEVR